MNSVVSNYKALVNITTTQVSLYKQKATEYSNISYYQHMRVSYYSNSYKEEAGKVMRYRIESWLWRILCGVFTSLAIVGLAR